MNILQEEQKSTIGNATRSAAHGELTSTCAISQVSQMVFSCQEPLETPEGPYKQFKKPTLNL